MASPAATKRLNKEYRNFVAEPVPYVVARPLEDNILEWHYIITGPPDTPYSGGQYHGKLRFTPDYPFKPPSIMMITPSGRFKPNQRLCLSISDFHPETWNPAWTVETILTGLLSFMTSNEVSIGGMISEVEIKKKYARESRKWNAKNKQFLEIFPDFVDGATKELVTPTSTEDDAVPKRKHSVEEIGLEKKPKWGDETVHLDSHVGGEQNPITLDDDDNDDDNDDGDSFFEDFETFDSDGEDDVSDFEDSNGVIVID